VPLERAEGKILAHDATASDGTRLRKGRPLSSADVAALRETGRTVVWVAEPGYEDVGEDEAARRVAAAALGSGLAASGPESGRANLLATVHGVLRFDPGRLARLNGLDGVAFATLPVHATVRPGQAVATVKIIPFALPAAVVKDAEAVAAEAGPLLHVDPLPSRAVGLILSGPPSARERVLAAFDPPLRGRVEALGSTVSMVEFVPLDDESAEQPLAAALQRQAAAGAGLIVLAGETAVVDRHDVTPRAIERAGGEVACFGAPVDPGNLLLLAHLGAVPILGAPGCARSTKANVIDAVLPRLLAGERLGRAEIAALGAGGLLEDAVDRPAPRG
jgi:molybdenum cofactor cytidylyltransferase